jgi:hypothetical protein
VDDGGTFTKNGGTIYGDDGDDLKKNTAGTLFTPGDGHAVYADPSNWRNDTAGPGIMLNSSLSGSEGGWDGDAS